MRRYSMKSVGEFGGPGRDRTDDLFHAMEARSQLRHRPTRTDRNGVEGVTAFILAGMEGIVKRPGRQSLLKMLRSSVARTLRLHISGVFFHRLFFHNLSC